MSERVGNRRIRSHRVRPGGRRRASAGPRDRMGALRRLGRARRREGPRPLREARRRTSTATSRQPRPGACSEARRSSSRRSSRTRRPRRRLADLGARLAPTTPCSPRRPRRCRSASSPRASGHPERFVGLHVFNPVPKMDADRARLPAARRPSDTRERARALCEALGKTAVEVPDTPGFVVNRLLFPYLFERRAADGAHRPGRRGDRHLHAPRRRPPDGPARAARPRRPRRQRRDRRDDRRRSARAGSTR